MLCIINFTFFNFFWKIIFYYIFIIVGTKKNKTSEIKIRLENDLKKQYQSYCKKNKIVMSKNIRELIEKEINNC